MKKSDVAILIAAIRKAFPQEIVGDDDQGVAGAYQDVGNAVRDAKLIAPLSGSALMKETAGTITPLVECILDGAPPTVNTTSGNAFGFAVGIAGNVRTINRPGTGLKWISCGDVTALVFFRLMRNQQCVLPWIPIITVGPQTFGEPISPAAARSTFTNNAAVSFVATQPWYKVDFDQVQIFNASGAIVLLQALVTNGNAQLT